MKDYHGNELVECNTEELDKVLPKDCFIIAHVGDGEYTCNIFGNIYSNFSTALVKVRNHHPNCVVYKYVIRKTWAGEEVVNGEEYFYIGDPIYIRSIKEHGYSKITRLTIEQLDAEFDNLNRE